MTRGWRFSALRSGCDRHDTGAKYSLDRGGRNKRQAASFLPRRYMDAYAKEISQFIDSVKNDKERRSGLRRLMDVVTGLAAKKSIKINAPVKIKDILSVYGL